jgi:hypothetical protein
MTNETQQAADINPSNALVLSTWFIMYLHEEGRDHRPGGLPNDFLTNGAASLLIFDEVLCDAYALEAEEEFKNVWISSDIFLNLKQEGILRPIDMRDFFRKSYFDHLLERGFIDSARRQIEAELQIIKGGIQNLDNLQLPDLLTKLNHYMFIGLDVPNGLRYEWQENHFKVSTSSTSFSHQVPVELDEDLKEKIEQEQRLISVVKTLLPKISLLPRVQGDSLFALQQNISREKPALYRWIYGDPEMPRERYHEYRLSQEFREVDRIIDNVSRRSQAEHNFSVIMRARQSTKDVRAGVQKIISDVVGGNKTLEDVQNDLEQHMKELRSYLPSQHYTTVDVGLSGVELAVAVAEELNVLSGLVPGYTRPSDITTSTYKFWQERADRHGYSDIRQRYPLAWLLHDFQEIQQYPRP